MAMNQLGLGLCEARHLEDAVSVQEAELSMRRRLGDSERNLLSVQSNIVCTYQLLGRLEKVLSMRRDIYFGRLRLAGEEDGLTLIAANNYGIALVDLRCFEEAKRLLRKTIPVARRVLGAEHARTLSLREDLARATLDGDSSSKEKRKALQMLEDTVAVMRRVLGPQHPETQRMKESLEIYREEFPTTA